MAKKNVRGTCKLCLKPSVLCKSHYLGRALHALSEEDGQHPVVMTPQLIKSTPRQVWSHLLCSLCEERLNKYGETSVLKLVNRGNDFKLLEAMNVAIPLGRAAPAVVKFSGSAMGIDTDSLAHFALGLLWRGAVNQWKTLKQQTTSVALEQYEEPIRKYLAGEERFPEGVCGGCKKNCVNGHGSKKIGDPWHWTTS